MSIKKPRFHKIVLREAEVFGKSVATVLAHMRYRRNGGYKVYHKEDGTWLLVLIRDFVRDIGLSEKTIRNALQKLEATNVVSRRRIKAPHGRWCYIYKMDNHIMEKVLRGDFSACQIETPKRGLINPPVNGTIPGKNDIPITGKNYHSTHYISKNERGGETPSLSPPLSGNAVAFQPDDGVIRASLSDGRAEDHLQAEELNIPESLDVRGLPTSLGSVLEKWFASVKATSEETIQARLEDCAFAETNQKHGMPNTDALGGSERNPTPNHTQTSQADIKPVAPTLKREQSTSPLVDVVANNIFSLAEEHYSSLAIGAGKQRPSIHLIRKTIDKYYRDNPKQLMEKVVKELREHPTESLSDFLCSDKINDNFS